MRYLFGCIVLVLPLASEGQEKKAGKLDAKKAEAIVKAFADKNVGAASIKWEKWGPHDLACKSGLAPQNLDAYPAKGAKVDPKVPLPIVRVRYREQDEEGVFRVQDFLFGIQGGKIAFVALNPYGDDWVAEFRKRGKDRDKFGKVKQP